MRFRTESKFSRAYHFRDIAQMIRQRKAERSVLPRLRVPEVRSILFQALLSSPYLAAGMRFRFPRFFVQPSLCGGGEAPQILPHPVGRLLSHRYRATADKPFPAELHRCSAHSAYHQHGAESTTAFAYFLPLSGIRLSKRELRFPFPTISHENRYQHLFFGGSF